MNMTSMVIQPLTQDNALIIANNWKYDGIYDFYNYTNDLEDYEEIIDPNKRKDQFFECLINNQLIGYFSVEKENDSIIFGLGLQPTLTGKGLGESFINQIEIFIKEQYKDIRTIALAVVDFNQRAYKVYKKCGFINTGKRKMPSNGGLYTFIEMKKDI